MSTRCLLFMLLAFGYFAGSAQVSPYYQIAVGQSGGDLKDSLHSIIAGHTVFPYTSSSTDVWDILKETDRDPDNPDNVILLYSGASVDAAQEYNSGKGWTREHVWAKSRGDFGTDPPAGTDVHHLRPASLGINSTRSNRSFHNCVTCTEVLFGDSATGSSYDPNNWTFEPRDAIKGDIARMIFYMAVRYEGHNGDLDLELSDTLYGQSSKLPLHSVFTTLLTWNRADTVDAFERNRNEVIYSQFQGNRNPFIDHPNLAEYIWGDSTGYAWQQVPTGAPTAEKPSYRLAPNPAGSFTILTHSGPSAAPDIAVYDATGRELTGHVSISKIGSGNLKISLDRLKRGMYIIRISGASFHTSEILMVH